MLRHLEFDRLHNFRDLGGYPGYGGRTVRWQQLYRSDSLAKLDGADWDRYRQLQVKTVIDLRYPFEIETRGRVPHADGQAYHNLSIEHRPYSQPSLDPDIDPGPYFADRYAEVTEDGLVELRSVIELIAADGRRPVAFHCATGKDRTGIIAALLLALLGVREQDIIEDYALTAVATPKFIDDWYADERNPPLRWPGYGTAPAEAMRLFLQRLTAEHGSVEGYVTGAVGVRPETVAKLRDDLLE
jgi:protein-tyrosine phosphatase